MQISDLVLAKKYVSKADNARKRNIDFTLTLTGFRNLMNAKTCYYTGIALTDGSEEIPLGTKRTIDRIDHKKPYEKGNVVACCHAFNQLKNELEKTGAIAEIGFQRAVAKAFNGVNASRGSKKKVVVK